MLVLDSLEDPQNVGTLLRSAEAAGVHGVVFPIERQAPLSPAAVKASAGATEHLLLAPVDDLPATLTDLHLRGLRIIGSDGEAPLTAREADLRGPIALVVGSEGHGLSPAVRRRCDLFVRIPMRGAIGSLNAAVAGSILLFETLGQRDAGRADADIPPSKGAQHRQRCETAGPAKPKAPAVVAEAATERSQRSAEPPPEATPNAPTKALGVAPEAVTEVRGGPGDRPRSAPAKQSGRAGRRRRRTPSAPRRPLLPTSQPRPARTRRPVCPRLTASPEPTYHLPAFRRRFGLPCAPT